MSGRHQPQHGADSDSGPNDRDCDRCGRRIYTGFLHPFRIAHRTYWYCAQCIELDAKRYAEMTGDVA
jgi:hypothetical protein